MIGGNEKDWGGLEGEDFLFMIAISLVLDMIPYSHAHFPFYIVRCHHVCLIFVRERGVGGQCTEL